MSIRIEIETRSTHEITIDLAGKPLTAETVRTLLVETPTQDRLDLGHAPLISDTWLHAIEVDVPNPAYAGPDTLFGNPPPPTIVERIEL